MEDDTSFLINRLGVTGYTLESATRVNKLWVQPNEIQSYLARYAQRFVCNTGWDKYQFQHLGTAKGIRIDNRFFTISTDHQRKCGTEGELGILGDPGESAFFPGTMFKINPESRSDLDDNFDWCIFEFNPDDYDGNSISSQFFEINRTDVGIKGRSGTFALNIGYPTSIQDVDYDNNKVALKLSSNIVKIVGETSTKGVYEFQTLSKDRYLEDGMSGSPVFEVYRGIDGFQVRLLGIVIRGGAISRIGRVVCAHHILESLQVMAQIS